jgi:thymidylate kinase
MFTVALVGADGAGKSTIGRRLASTLPFPVRYLYMGDNPESANHRLPTMRLIRGFRRARVAVTRRRGPPDPSRKSPPAGVRAAPGSVMKVTLRLIHRLADEWYRQALAWYYQRRGYIVLFDRHFFADYYAHHIAPTQGVTWSGRVHGIVLKRLYPTPDLMICLDAPAEVLFARKPEGTLDALERRRREYFHMRDLVDRFAVVDANRPEDDVARDVAALIEAFHRTRVRGRPEASQRQ